MNKHPKMRWSDIWVLVSAYYASLSGGNSISKIIGAADAINHAIINYEELSSALVRLSDHGLITVNANPWRIMCTEKGNEIVRLIAEKNSLALKVWENVEAYLNVEPWTPPEPIPHPENNLEFPGFTKDIYNSAVAEYLETMGKQ